MNARCALRRGYARHNPSRTSSCGSRAGSIPAKGNSSSQCAFYQVAPFDSCAISSLVMANWFPCIAIIRQTPPSHHYSGQCPRVQVPEPLAQVLIVVRLAAKHFCPHRDKAPKTVLNNALDVTAVPWLDPLLRKKEEPQAHHPGPGNLSMRYPSEEATKS